MWRNETDAFISLTERLQSSDGEISSLAGRQQRQQLQSSVSVHWVCVQAQYRPFYTAAILTLNSWVNTDVTDDTY